ncbi:MAG: hypothetical protein V4672_09230 [Verrucomicrobiota bacterium]
MNAPFSRRRFLAEVSRGTLLATIGPALAAELGITSPALAEDAPGALSFGKMEALVCFMQETAVEKLQSGLTSRLRSGTSLKQLVAAGALANARTFGGEDYIGFHTLMALSPAWKMAGSLPAPQAALPVFKVLYRNTHRIQENGGREDEVLHTVIPAPGQPTPAQLHEAVRSKDTAQAEQLFAAMVGQDKDQAFNALLECVQDDTEVHRTVLPYRAWDLLDVVGQEHAHTLLRQSLRYCLQAEGRRRPEWDLHAKVLTGLLDEHKLLGRDPGTRAAEDAFVEKLSHTIFSSSPEAAAGAVAAALAEGFDPAEIGEALSLAANQIVLRDRGRPPEWEFTGKPTGSVHGDSIGVHASDSVHAWRNLAHASHGRNSFACLILGAWQIARDREGSRQPFLTWEPLPSKRQVGTITAKEPAALLTELEAMVRQNMQSHAGAVVQRYSLLGHAPEPVFQLLLKYAISEDGALHAEKYYQTVWDEFHRTRPAFRWRHLTALARVTASEYGRPAPGQTEARELLAV